MSREIERRELLKLMSIGGVVFASNLFRPLAGCSSVGSHANREPDAGRTSQDDAMGGEARESAAPPPGTPRGAAEDFFFMQLSDTHWGFSGPAVNPNAALELKKAVAAINAAVVKPDFIVFTGDLTHTTDDVDERRRRMTEFRQIVADLAVPQVKFMPGEHDAAADEGAIYREIFGEPYYSFDHKGIHFIALDNVSDPRARIGESQLAWLRQDLARLDADAPIVVLAHRPLWDLKPEWDWTTADGAAVIDILTPYQNVVVFFGHIHQELHHMTGHIAHHAARSLMFALPTPETSGMRTPVPWDPQKPELGLGYRSVAAATEPDAYQLEELLLVGQMP